MGRPRKNAVAAKSGPSQYKRDEDGLLSNVNYTFNEDGSIDWRAMIKEEHLFPNKSWFEARKKEIPSSIEGLEDHQLLIKLSGIKELARLRGFSSVSYTTERCDNDHVAVSCTIKFIGNYETSGEVVIFQDMANATLNNTSSFATKFLETIACNRAFVRAVRNFLNVHIVGDDEIDKSNGKILSPQQSQSLVSLSPASVLEKQAVEKLSCTSFEDFKTHLRNWWTTNQFRNENVKNWSSFEDIPAKDARILLALINS